MEKTIKKVIYSDYKDKYDDTIITQLGTSPESIDVETMRENLYGYTFTKEYAEGKIPDELSMDYWEEQRLKNDPLDTIISSNNPEFFTPDGMIKDYCLVSPQELLILKAIDSTGDGKTEGTALCVIDVHQEYEYIERVWQYCCSRLVRQYVKNGIDCLVLKDMDGNEEKVFFDISRRFEVGYK